ncbi:TonB-dependent receptor [Sphingomonas sp. 2R-10]|uniref:TonB-dependent receptor plug domain-containing protein n=1 Tax=Sphingomonas sp. 2R-10 TaxID=3045148 RepID=UPI0019D274DE|nr:TonB-dependent receptor [Sphingomonas sp. 2R-10]MDJ0276415.1 TonB-dependent receptor [Sphingomonas sp. 2R-10]
MRAFRSKFALLAAVSAIGLSGVAGAQQSPSSVQAGAEGQDDRQKARAAAEEQVSTQDTVIEPADANADAPPVAGDSPENTIEVTGSRLYDGDVTSKKVVIDREEIKRRGVTSVEDLIRTLPQNVATIGAVTNERNSGPLSNRSGQSSVSKLGSLGVSAANLFGAGASNTLVLVNGRRMAGAAGIEDGFVNLNGIPLSAIERVEIIPSGAAAVYGADAMTGVINFILRKDYRGVTLGSQAQFSNNGRDSARFNAYAGFAWGSGSISGTADFQRQKPVVNSKTGYVTEDYSALFGGDPYFNQRSVANGLQPGIIDNSSGAFDPDTGEFVYAYRYLTPGPGAGTRPTADQFVVVGPDRLRDYIPRLAGPLSDTLGFTLNLDQNITGRLKFFANALYSRGTNVQEEDGGRGLTVTLAPGQYYNPFAAYELDPDGFSPGVQVNYFPQDEARRGIVTPSTIRNTAEQWNVNAGLTYDFNKNTRLTAIYTTSQSKTKASGSQLGSIIGIAESTTNPGTFTCTDFEIDSGLLTGDALTRRRAIFDRQCRALTSTDPAVAFNPFKTSGDGPGGSIRDFFYQYDSEDRSSRAEQVEARLTGRLMNLPAGPLSYAIGGEYNDDGANSREINAVTGAAGSRSRYAFFAEVSLPILGNGYDLPLAHALTFNLAGRRDTSRIDGPIGTVGDVPFRPGVPLRFGRNEFTRFTPSFGLNYQPVEGVTILAKWGRGFQPPPFTQLFRPDASQRLRDVVITGDPRNPGITYRVPAFVSPNPDLLPQTSRQESFTLAWQPPGGALQGLNASATYNRTVIRNQFARADDVAKIVRPAEYYLLEQFFPRGPDGRITQFRSRTINLIGSEYRSMTYEISYFLMTGIGNFEPRLTVVDNLKSESRALPGSVPVDTLGKLQGPDDYRLVGSLTYARGKLSATLWGYHTPAYTNDYLVDYAAGLLNNTENGFPRAFRVSPYTVFDLTASLKTHERFTFNLASRNILDAKPPFTVVQGRPYDTVRYNIEGRTVMFQVEYVF